MGPREFAKQLLGIWNGPGSQLSEPSRNAKRSGQRLGLLAHRPQQVLSHRPVPQPHPAHDVGRDPSSGSKRHRKQEDRGTDQHDDRPGRQSPELRAAQRSDDAGEDAEDRRKDEHHVQTLGLESRGRTGNDQHGRHHSNGAHDVDGVVSCPPPRIAGRQGSGGA